MSDYFFYDINKKMADLANKQQLAEDAQAAPVNPAPNKLMEAAADYSAKKAAAGKDIGKPGKNFSKIAAGAAKRYGSAEAGKRVAGAVLNKLRHPSEGVAEGVSNIKEKIIKLYKKGLSDDEIASRLKIDSDDVKSVLDDYEWVADTTGKEIRKTAREGNAFSGAVVKAKRDGIQPGEKVQVGGKTYPLRETDATPQDVASYKPEVKTVNAPQRKASAPVPPKKSMADKIRDKLTAPRFPSDPGVITDKFPKPSGQPADKKAMPPKKPAMYPPQAIDEPVKEGGVPMTPKQKKFAALAKPFDKISFADKIVGAKKEVDEMLGDVAASAMKKAVRGRNRDMEEASDWSKLHEPFKAGHFDDTPTRRKSSSGGEIDTSEPGVTRHRPVKGNYSGAAHDAGADNEPTGAVGRRPVGAGQGKKIGAKINRGTSKLMTKKGDMTDEDMFEPRDSGEYDREGEMAKDDIKTVVRHAQALEKILGDEDNLPEWVQSKLAKIEGMMTAVDDYMQNQKSGDMEMDEESTNKRDNRAERAGRKVAKDIEYDERQKDGIHGRRRGSEDSKAERAGRRVTKDIEYDEKKKKNESSDQHFDKGYYDSMDAAKKDNPKSITKARKQPFEEESTNKRDNRAERAGRKVARDIEYDEREKDGIHGRRRDSEDSRAERAGKKVTKDIEYDEKKDKKKKEVDETTSSGSVATGGAAPKSGGGMKVGTGIYDSLNRQLENVISESMNINMSMNNDEHGGPKKSLTVTATDEDAVMLSSLLKMAGLGNDDDHIHDMTGDDSQMLAIQTMGDEEACPSCGSSSCGCDSEEMYEGLYDSGAKAAFKLAPEAEAALAKYGPEVLQKIKDLIQSTGGPKITKLPYMGPPKEVDDFAAQVLKSPYEPGIAKPTNRIPTIDKAPQMRKSNDTPVFDKSTRQSGMARDPFDPLVDEDRWGAEPPKLPNDMTVTAPGGVDVSKDGSNWVYKSNEPGGRVTVTIPAKASNKMFPKTDMDEAYGDTDATQNEPDWPTDQEGTDNAMMYSGGIDGPKSTGQTTIPVNAGQKDRMGHAGDNELRRMMEIAGLR